ncbi:MAG: SseB family protein [Hyphomonadaceae bacterium]|nr:SseB family protein [Hyphomonadaceae bacterium]
MRRRQILIAAAGLVAWPAIAAAQTPGPATQTPPQRTPPTPPPLITAQNELERAFLAALGDPEARPAFRRELMVSQIALALESAEPDAEPRQVAIGPQITAAAVFTSTERLNNVLGPSSARRVMSGRQAFERLRGQHIVLNYRLAPMLTLEPEDVEQYLATPTARP